MVPSMAFNGPPGGMSLCDPPQSVRNNGRVEQRNWDSGIWKADSVQADKALDATSVVQAN